MIGALGWPEVALAAVGAAQVVALAVLALYERQTSRKVSEVSSTLDAAQNGGDGEHGALDARPQR